MLILTESDFVSRHFDGSGSDIRKMGVVLYEDDDQACVIQDDPNRVRDEIGNLALWGIVGYFVPVACQSGASGLECGLGIWGAIIGTVSAMWSIFQTNDDYLGLAVEKSNVSGFSDANATHALILDGNSMTQNGGVRLVYHTYGS